MEETLPRLKRHLAEVYDLQVVAGLLEWDQQTYMPAGGAATRAEQTATIRKIAHEKLAADETGEWLTTARAQLNGADPDGDDARLLKVATMDYERARAVPPELVAEMSRATALAQEKWVAARAQQNFALFLPYVEKVFELKRQVAACFKNQESPYDPLLDEYEPGMKTAQVRAIFAELKRELVPLVHAIAEKPETDDAVLRLNYDERQQWDFSLRVIERFGFDMRRGRQDKAAHPFCSGFGVGDVRLTIRLNANYFNTALMSAMHEAGHGLYEQGFAPEHTRSPLTGGASLGLHESQSRLWENLVGRSRGFWTYWYPQLQTTFPESLAQVKFDTFYRAINKVKPSFIRVEADEVTYNLHTLLRFEIEVDMLEGRIQAKDLPALWNAKFKEYFGLDLPHDGVGVLQDVHWALGLVGYFPTYTLGNLASVQLYEQAVRDVPSIPADIERGEFSGLLNWMRQNVHQPGRKFAPNELLQRATGQPLTATPYLGYLKRKYGELYHL